MQHAIAFFFLTERPSIVSPRDQQEFIVHEQRNTTLTCIATGSPAPSISFFYKNKNVDDDYVFDDRVMLGNESMFTNSSGLYMVIRNFKLTNSMDEDSGSIVCSASADIPSVGRMVANKSLNLTVYGKIQSINFQIFAKYYYCYLFKLFLQWLLIL